MSHTNKWQIMEGIEQPNQEKNQNAQRKGNLKYLGSGRHQTSGDERKNFKKNTTRE